MIFVIGDIHGMIRPLERILGAVEDFHRETEPVERLIFLGDYINHGEDSRQVIDRLLDLSLPAVFLAGDHEDLLLRFVREGWSAHGIHGQHFLDNGGAVTVESFDWELERWDAFFALVAGGLPEAEALAGPHAETVRYARFFRDLAYSHHETFECGGRRIGFSFFHGLPRLDQPLEMQRAATFEEYDLYREVEWDRLSYSELTAAGQYRLSLVRDESRFACGRHPAGLEETFLTGWRYSFRFPYGGEVVVHGHNPVPLYPKRYRLEGPAAAACGRQFAAYPEGSHLPFLFSRGAGAGYAEAPAGADGGGKDPARPLGERTVTYGCGRGGAVEAVNVDTGCVYEGGALTALGLSAESLARGELLTLTAPTVPSDRPRRPKGKAREEPSPLTRPRVLARTIRCGRFGADMKDTVGNAPFPFELFRPAPRGPE